MGISNWRARSGILAAWAIRAHFKSAFMHVSTLALLVLGGQALQPLPAVADGTIFALVTLTNNSSTTISLPAGNAHSDQGDQGFGLPSGATDFGMPGPGGLPAAILGPGQTTVFGTMSNGGFLAPSGTGGHLDVPQAGKTVTWQAPWGNFNGLFDTCSSTITNDPPPSGSTFTDPPSVTITGGYVSFGYGPNTCVFDFIIN